jgi:DnaJ-domain-containing protein 1
VPGDAPSAFDPDVLLTALREDVDVRDRRLVALAREVAEERERLREDRVRLAEDREAFELERASERMRRSRATAAGTASPAPVDIPRTARDALALLALAPGATPSQVERAWRDQVVRCHPDRVVDLHPEIRGRAEGLTVALNAARDLLLGGAPSRARRASG